MSKSVHAGPAVRVAALPGDVVAALRSMIGLARTEPVKGEAAARDGFQAVFSSVPTPEGGDVVGVGGWQTPEQLRETRRRAVKNTYTIQYSMRFGEAPVKEIMAVTMGAASEDQVWQVMAWLASVEYSLDIQEKAMLSAGCDTEVMQIAEARSVVMQVFYALGIAYGMDGEIEDYLNL